MSRPSRLFWWLSLGGLAVILIVMLVAGAAWIRSYLRSEDFRRLVDDKTGAALRSETVYSPFGWSGSSVFSDSLQGTGLEGSPVKNFRADQLRAEVNWRAIFDGAWRVDEITVGYFEGTFRQPVHVENAPTAPQPTASPSGLRQYLPQRFELGTLQVAQARLGFLDAQGQEALAVRDTALTLRQDGSSWVINGQRGVLNVRGVPQLDIDSFRSRLQRDAFFLTDAQLRLGETGKVTASGEIASNSQVEVEWQQVDVAPFLPGDWKSHVSGFLSGTSVIKWGAAGMSEATATGKFELKDGLIQGVPMLDQIATFTGAPQFRRMPLQQMTGSYSWAKGLLTLTNIVAESKGLLRVEGTCVVAPDGRIQSALRLGVTPQTLQWLPGSRERVFTVAQNGYLWTDVQVSGTLQSPQEDLSARLIAAMGNEVIDQGTKVIEQLPGGVKDGAQKALDLLSPFLGR